MKHDGTFLSSFTHDVMIVMTTFVPTAAVFFDLSRVATQNFDLDKHRRRQTRVRSADAKPWTKRCETL